MDVLFRPSHRQLIARSKDQPVTNNSWITFVHSLGFGIKTTQIFEELDSLIG